MPNPKSIIIYNMLIEHNYLIESIRDVQKGTQIMFKNRFIVMVYDYGRVSFQGMPDPDTIKFMTEYLNSSP